MKKIMSYILNPIKADKEGAAKMNTKIRKAIGIVGIILAVYIIFKYIFVYVAPFLVAFLIVRILNPAAIRLQKYPCFRKVGKGSLLFCMMSLILGTTGVCMWFLGVRLFAQIRSIFLHIDQYEAKMETMIDGCCVLLNQKFGVKSEAVREIVYQNMNLKQILNTFLEFQYRNMTKKYNVLLEKELEKKEVQEGLIEACDVIDLIIAVVSMVAVLLIIKDYDEICQKLQKYSTFRHLVRIGERLWQMAGLWLRAQLLIMAAVMAECVAGLWVLQNSYALLVGILIGFLDALPFIGTGTILLPWAALELFRGDFFHAAAYLTFFLITNSTRDFLEPRLLGEKLGVYPIVIAVVVYVGICIFGPAGVLLGPLMLLVIREVVREWLEA